MKIAISGATGFIGTRLSEYLRAKGHEVLPLERWIFEHRALDALAAAVQECQAVVNLAGAPLVHRWSERYRRLLYSSRIGPTRLLVEAINRSRRKPRVMISASTVGYYPAEGCYDDYQSENGSGFLAQLCAQWEREARHLTPDVRLAVARLGLVFAPDGGLFARLAAPARKGIATVLGSGRQTLCWIDREDAVRALETILDDRSLRGAVNLCAPAHLSYADFAAALAARYDSRLTLRIPKPALQMFFGQAALALTEGHCALPLKLTQAGFAFRSRTVDRFLETIR